MKPWNLKQVSLDNKALFLQTVEEVQKQRKLTPAEEALVWKFENSSLKFKPN